MHERALYRIDAVFEATLAAVLIVGVASGWLRDTDFPAPATPLVLLAFGVLLAIVAGYLYFGAQEVLMPLALANDITGLAAIAWLIAANGFSTTGTILVIATIVGLFGLSSAQLRTARRIA